MKLPTLDSVKNINVKDTKTITILIIVVIVLFAIVYVWLNRKNVEEGFAQYNVNEGDLVVLPNLESVIVDTIGNQKNQKLPDALNMLIDTRNATTLSNTYAKVSDLSNTNINLSSNASSLLNTISSMNALSTRLTNDLSIMNSIISSNVALVNNNLTSNVALMNGLVNNAPPALTVVAYFGSTAPPGWQLCDGLSLMSMDTPPQQVFYTIGTSVKELNTPNLLGRFILGATTNINATAQIPSSISLRNDVGATGGEEKVKLDIKEMPAHAHSYGSMRNDIGNEYYRGSLIGYSNPNWYPLKQNEDPSGNTGGDSTMTQIQDPNFPSDSTKKMNDTKPHNNMPPYYSLIYIIKKPLRGGVANPVAQPSPLITN